jgi:hypothetical protein
MYYITIINTDGTTEQSEQEDCPDLAQLRKAVGGSIEAVPYWERWQDRQAVAFCNEEGKLEGLPINDRATMFWNLATSPWRTDDCLAGNVIIIATDTDEEMAKL